MANLYDHVQRQVQVTSGLVRGATAALTASVPYGPLSKRAEKVLDASGSYTERQVAYKIANIIQQFSNDNIVRRLLS